MKSKDLKDAILIIAIHIDPVNGKRIWENLVNSVTMPELTRMIVVKMFIHNITDDDHLYYQEDDHNIYNAIQLVREYMVILDKVGYMTFEE